MIPTLTDIAKQMPYPGRFLILGNQAGHIVAVYGVTARSTAKPAKEYVFSEDKKSIHVEPVDRSTWHHENIELLDYTAVRFFDQGLVIGNGRQVDRTTELNKASAIEQLRHDLHSESYEPDKYSTPRITGCILKRDDTLTAALSILRNDGSGATIRNFFPIDLTVDNTQFISTYAGQNVRPTPSFVGDPIDFTLPAGDAKQIAEYIYQSFAPEVGLDDLRISITAIRLDITTLDRQTYIINIEQ